MGMILHALFCALGLAVNVGLAAFVLARDPAKTVNRSFSAFAFSIAYWALMKLGGALSSDAETASFWFRLSGPGWCFLPALYLHFVESYTGRRVLFGWRYAHAVLYAISALLSVSLWVGDLTLAGMEETSWGFAHVPGPVYRYVFFPYLVLAFLHAAFLLSRHAGAARHTNERMGSVFLLIGLAFPLVVGTLTNSLLPMLGVRVIELAIPLTTVNALFVAVAATRFRVFPFTPEMAATAIVTTMGDALFAFDRDGRVALVNPAAESLTGIPAPEMVGRRSEELFGHPLLTSEVMEELRTKGIFRGELTLRARNRTTVAVSLCASPLKDRAGEIAGVLCLAQDIREIKRLLVEVEATKRRIEEAVIVDALTGVYNRRYLSLRLREELLRSQRYASPFSVIILDADHFTDVRAARGRAAVEEILKQIAETLRRELRQTDVITRSAEDEFVLVLPDTVRESACGVAEKLKSALAPLQISISFGVATVRPESLPEAEETVLSWADAALLSAKRAGGNRVLHVEELTGWAKA